MKEALVGTLDLNAKLISMEILNLEQHEILLWIRGCYFCQKQSEVSSINNADIVLLFIPSLWKECEKCKYAVLSSLHGKNWWDAKTITCKVNVDNSVCIFQK